MNLSDSLTLSIRRLFCGNKYYSRHVRGGLYNIDLNYEKNSLFSRFVNTSIYRDKEFFIPVINLDDTIQFICKWAVRDSKEKEVELYYPLYYSTTYTRSTADSIIGTFTDYFDDRFCKVTTSKDVTFYGGSGAIFDQNWNPLILCGYNIKLSSTAKQAGTENEIFESINPVVYVSPCVFTNTDIISKAILKKIIPFLCNNYVNTPTKVYDITHKSIHTDITIEVRNLDDYFTSPIATSDLKDSEVWDILDLYKDKICY